MSGHVFVVGADLTRLSCDDVLVPTGRTLRISPGWCPLLPGDLVSDADDEGACVVLSWEGDERVLAVPGEGARRTWLVDTVDDAGRGLPWLLDGAREALAAVAVRCSSSCCPCCARPPRSTVSTSPWCSSGPATWPPPSGCAAPGTAAGTCPGTCGSWPGSWGSGPGAGSSRCSSAPG